MTLIETLLTVMLSGLMVLPMMGWAGLALDEQVRTQERNISSTSLGLLRLYYVRDVTNATSAAVEGPAMEECSTGAKGDRVLLVLANGDRRIAYSLRSDDGFTSMLQRLECAEPGGPVVDAVDLAGDVIQGGTNARCNTGADLAAAAVAAGVVATEKKGGGGKEDVEGSLKVRIPHSSAIVKAIAEGTIEWQQDEDFGYQVATSVPGIDAADAGILRPKELYAKLGRSDEYATWVERLKTERREFLATFPELKPEIRDAV